MLTRIVTGTLLVPLIGVIYWAPPQWCLVLFAIGAVLSFLELCRFIEAADLIPLRVTGIFLVLGLVSAFSLPVWGAGLILAIAVVSLPCAWFVRRLPIEPAFLSLGANLLAVVVAGVFMGFQMAIRMEGSEGDGSLGGALLVFLYATVFAGDTAAYFTGRAIGKHKMAPTISPKKTWEGFAGGLAGSMLGGWMASRLFADLLPLWSLLVLSLLVGVAGVIGDLTISLLKRSVGLKDTGALLPGHGGVLDRLDSLVLSGPVLFYYLKYVAQVG